MGDSALGVNGRADAVRADASQSSPLFSPVTIDVFHLPSGVEPAEYATYDVTTEAGVRQLRYPMLNGSDITALARQLTEARARRLAAMSVNDILDVLARAAELWTDPDFELRRQAELLIPAITGYQPDMVRIELKRYMRQFRRRELLRFLDAEIGQPAMLDGFRPNKAGGYSRYVGPRLTYQVFSSNVPGIPVWSMVMTLLVKGAILGKSSFSEPVMPALFARSIAMIDPELADAIAVVPWKGGSQELEDPAIDAADAVIVYGSSTTTKLIAGKVAGAKPCLGTGRRSVWRSSGARRCGRIRMPTPCIARPSISPPTTSRAVWPRRPYSSRPVERLPRAKSPSCWAANWRASSANTRVRC